MPINVLQSRHFLHTSWYFITVKFLYPSTAYIAEGLASLLYQTKLKQTAGTKTTVSGDPFWNQNYSLRISFLEPKLQSQDIFFGTKTTVSGYLFWNQNYGLRISLLGPKLRSQGILFGPYFREHCPGCAVILMCVVRELSAALKSPTLFFPGRGGPTHNIFHHHPIIRILFHPPL